MGRLDGKVALITGGANGIGKACAERFVSEGAKVVIADVAREAGEATAKALGANARFIACDVGAKAEVDAMVAGTVEAFGALDVLVNNAAVIKAADFLGISEADFDAVLRVNLKGAFWWRRRRPVRWWRRPTPGANLARWSTCRR
jgi:NAD(P)-dependent dehydrogenase (short-subunit alcohol dehydrogenase family)